MHVKRCTETDTDSGGLPVLSIDRIYACAHIDLIDSDGLPALSTEKGDLIETSFNKQQALCHFTRVFFTHVHI